ncbi:hypothetical protein GTY64_28865 [Streptomyces sp. SID8376]|nr:hypothetical protein [Streptomyces sp. XHT-2]MYQ32305.1 hypothetical protein [Streptomyces sp. SID4956]MYW55411.1 hypothetical protein [Streptomyces sp. SID8376]THC58112.1 hypothetical protein E7X38_04660 [Streptomyces sp. Akac8]
MCVNKRREPTTAPGTTRRPVRRVRFRHAVGSGGVVRPLREIASRNPGRVPRPFLPGFTHGLA